MFPVTVNDQWWGFIGFDQCKDDRLWSHAELDAMRTASSTIGSAIQRQLAEQELHRLNEALEQRVAERTERLESANRELEAFSYSVSHDLRAPLRAIVGFSNILIEDFGEALGEDGCRVLRVIESNSLRMGGLIDDLISFARIGKQDLVGTAIDMANLVHQVADELRIAEAQHIAFKVDDLPRAKGDARLIRQVLLNLLSNALKYSALNPNPQITVSHFDDRKGMHVYAVRDNGVGFDMTYYDKLFSVFQRLHSNPEFEGTGIGLALVKRIIEKHGGSIWAEGKMGEGASFYFSLPGG